MSDPEFPTVDRHSFVPTPESIPPPNVTYRQKVPPGIPVHRHPLVRPFSYSFYEYVSERLALEPIGIPSSRGFDIPRSHCYYPLRCKAPGTLHLFCLVGSRRLSFLSSTLIHGLPGLSVFRTSPMHSSISASNPRIPWRSSPRTRLSS